MTTRTVSGGPRATVAAHGLRVALPPRWEARLFLRDGLGAGWDGESVNPVLHLANFALPTGRGDFGSGAVELMGSRHAFVSLLEYDATEAGQPLFAARGMPRPALDEFAPNALQRRLPGQLGCQRFFTENGRAFCLYVVLGSRTEAAGLVSDVHGVLDNLTVELR
ncbi:MAG TPA: hypothetical protein VKB75_00340 [Jatrophihabitans sp.]|nr:hypothetical protein [Jatrophihabitans sp.]